MCERQRWSTLTPRERQVALLVTQGLPNKGMARELAVNVRTVETDLLHVFAKLALFGAVELANAVHDKDLTWKHCPRGR